MSIKNHLTNWNRTPGTYNRLVSHYCTAAVDGKTAQVTGRADKTWAVAHFGVARLMRAAVGGGSQPLLKVSRELR